MDIKVWTKPPVFTPAALFFEGSKIPVNSNRCNTPPAYCRWIRTPGNRAFLSKPKDPPLIQWHGHRIYFL
jgi:hypothetical protein